jgi:hypothetical protein
VSPAERAGRALQPNADVAYSPWLAFYGHAGVAKKRQITKDGALRHAERVGQRADRGHLVWVGRQVGFVRRRLVKTADDEYVDIVEWESQAAAEKAMASPDHPEMSEMTKVLAVESMTVAQGLVIPPQ